MKKQIADQNIKEDDNLKPIPAIATYYFQPEKIDNYCDAMSDFLCWINGFQAAGGVYEPGSVESMRNLQDALKSIQSGHAKSNQAHES